MLVHAGGEVKCLGEGKFRAPLVIFGREAKDLDSDFFTPDTDLWQEFPATVPLIYAHGLDPQMKHTRLGDGKATLTKDDAGVWMEGQLNISDRYQAKIYEMIEAGKLGTSSGAIAHLVSRRAEGKSFELTSWPIAEASLTPKPCNPLNRVQAVKDFQSLDIPEFKDVMTTGDGYAPANPRSGGPAAPDPHLIGPDADRRHDMTPDGHSGDAVRCPSCHLWTHLDADHKTCPYCGVHLSTADTPPAGKSFGMSFGMSFSDELESALAAVESCTSRAGEIQSYRIKEGRTLSSANRAKLQSLWDGLAELLRVPEADKPKSQEAESHEGVNGLLAALTAHEAAHAVALAGL